MILSLINLLSNLFCKYYTEQCTGSDFGRFEKNDQNKRDDPSCLLKTKDGLHADFRPTTNEDLAVGCF
jgi:hypothetical protein